MESTKRKLLARVACVSAGLLIAGFVFIAPSVTAKQNRGRYVVTIPEHAVKLAPGVWSLGSSKDERGRNVQGLMLFTHKPKHNPPGGGGNPGGGGGGDKCFAHIARGAKWKTTEDYIVDPTNIDGLPDSFVRSTMATATATWNSGTTTTIFGSEDISGTVDTGAFGTLNFQNEVFFADIDSPGAVAVNIVWGIFTGPPSGRVLVEWDEVYDDVDYDFVDFGPGSATGAVMDFLNVAVHEVGHAAGMAHPGDTCTEESMFRFVSFEETKKRDLNAGDIAGINDLY